MAKCKHEKWLDTVTAGGVGTRVCSRCGHWLSLGPSNDAPDEVQVEIDAAMLAASGPWWNDPAHDSESYGFLCWQNGGTPGDDEDGGCSTYAQDEWVGYLAAVIAYHKEQP